MAKAFAVPFLGAIPIDPTMLASCERGEPFITKHPEAPAAKPFQAVIDGALSPPTLRALPIGRGGLLFHELTLCVCWVCSVGQACGRQQG